jgi:hypothetical protein
LEHDLHCVSAVIRFFALLLLLQPAACADDALLDAFRATITPMRGKPPGFGGPRGATPALTTAKHQLRDWIESRLAMLSERGDEGELARQLNSDLRAADLDCVYEPGPRACPDGFLLGYAAPVTLERQRAFLVVRTGVGIECGYDESAYVYSWTGEGWRRVWQTEQNTYTEEKYKPQHLDAVMISPYSSDNDYLVLTLGSQTWCQSNWHEVYYRAFRIGAGLQAAPIVEGSAWSFFDGYSPIHGSISHDDVLVEYNVFGGEFTREEIAHYRLGPEGARRIDPIALRPGDFVEAWLALDWKDAWPWTEQQHRHATRTLHDWRRKGKVAFELAPASKHCTVSDLWQVEMDVTEPPPEKGAEPKSKYFTVRWQRPYRFTMVQVSDEPSPDCTQADPQADDPARTLFPVQKRR